MKLSNTIRNITDVNGTIKVSNFSYSGYAARLLTVQEVNKGCGAIAGNYRTGELDTCQYLMENTKYTNNSLFAYWLESVHSSIADFAWRVYSDNRYVDMDAAGTSNLNGERPAIEVLKSKISY